MPARRGVSLGCCAPPRPPQLERGALRLDPLQRSLQTSPTASSSFVCRLAPPPPAHGPLSPGSGGLCLPPPLLQPTPASGMTPGLPTPRWGHPENQKPPWDSCRAGCRLSLCQTRAQPPQGSLHVPGWQMLCLLACRGRWPALPEGEQLTWVAGAGQQASRLPQGTSVTREGQPQPAGTRAAPGWGRGCRPKHGGLGSALTETLLPAPQGGTPLQPQGQSPVLPSLPSPLAAAAAASFLTEEGGLAQPPRAGCSSWREVPEKRLSTHAQDLSSYPCLKLQAVKGQGDIRGSWCEPGAGSNVSLTSFHLPNNPATCVLSRAPVSQGTDASHGHVTQSGCGDLQIRLQS